MKIHQIDELLSQALSGLRHDMCRGPISIDEIIEKMRVIGNSAFVLNRGDVKRAIFAWWGLGFEPVTIGGEYWRVGWSHPPVSREIGR